MNYKTPKVIFVDGFNAVGKDYAIDKISKLLSDLGYASVVVTLKDFMPSIVADKRYFTYVHFDDEALAKIVLGHKQAILKIADLIDTGYDNTVVIVNRSFLTAVNYNFHGVGANKSEAGIERQLENAISEYSAFHAANLDGQRCVLLNLCRHHDLRDGDVVYTARLMREKIMRRDSVSLFDVQYTENLVRSYQNPHPFLQTLGVEVINCNSDIAEAEVRKLLPSRITTSSLDY